MQRITMNILHFSWYSPNFPKLKYASSSLFGGRVKLYKLVPCVWLAMNVAFLIGVPLLVLVLDESTTSKKRQKTRELTDAIRVMPSCLLAAYAVGNLYMQTAHALFTLWLSTGIELSIIQRQFEHELDSLYLKLSRHVDYFVVTTEEIEKLSQMRSVEMWLKLETLKRQLERLDKGQLDEVEHLMNDGAWPEACKRLDSIFDSQKVNQKEYKAAMQRNASHCLIHSVYIVDTKADLSFWVVVPTGKLIREDGGGAFASLKKKKEKADAGNDSGNDSGDSDGILD